MSPSSITEVLIVGAGPTGLMLANQLARRGVGYMIIDRHAGPSVETRALGVQARTLEIYSHLGIAERGLELGKRATGANLWIEGRPAARIPLADMGRDLSPYPFLLILGQDDNERLLGEKLREHGIEVQWNTELIGLAQSPDEVRVTLRQADGSTREIRTRWVAGCDGAHSAVRTLNSIEFPGAPYEHVFFVADTTATGRMVPDELNVYLLNQGFHLFFPMRGRDHWRIVGILPPELRGRADLQFNAVATTVRTHVGGSLDFQECSWFSTYRIHHRRAERLRDRRCFLLGDAAHIHSPVGAQGMNTGLQDAYNLAWKLALVSSGRAPAALLDSYEAERLPVAQRLLQTTDRMFSLIVSDRLLSRIVRTRVLSRIAAFAMGFQRIQRLAFRTISQIGIQYRKSVLSETQTGIPEEAPHAGDRFPWLRVVVSPGGPVEDLFARLDDTRFNLIVVGQPPLSSEPAELSGLLRTHEISVDSANADELIRSHIPSPSFYLLRPDGHVGLVGTKLDGALVTRYLTERLGFGKASVG